MVLVKRALVKILSGCYYLKDVHNFYSFQFFKQTRLPAVSSSILFEIFPFVLVYGEDMVIQTIGRSLAQVYQ